MNCLASFALKTQERIVHNTSELDVVTDHVKMVRDRPEIYSPFKPRLSWLAINIVQTIILLKATPLTVKLIGNWVVISTDLDWLVGHDGKVSMKPFYTMTPFPEGGHDDFRREILLTAFTVATITEGQDGTTWLCGNGKEHPLPTDVMPLTIGNGEGRRLFFCVQEEEGLK